jgi:hypothetical protein
MTQQNDYGFPQWLKYLLDVMRPNWKDNGLGNEVAKAIALLDSFYDEDNEKMLTAVKQYLKTKRDAYIPFPGDLSACFPHVDTAPTRKSRAFHIWHRDEVAANWPICPKCQEHTPNVTDCPLCTDMKAEAKRNGELIAVLTAH